jgi:hypothetical protein
MLREVKQEEHSLQREEYVSPFLFKRTNYNDSIDFCFTIFREL